VELRKGGGGQPIKKNVKKGVNFEKFRRGGGGNRAFTMGTITVGTSLGEVKDGRMDRPMRGRKKAEN